MFTQKRVATSYQTVASTPARSSRKLRQKKNTELAENKILKIAAAEFLVWVQNSQKAEKFKQNFI